MLGQNGALTRQQAREIARPRMRCERVCPFRAIVDRHRPLVGPAPRPGLTYWAAPRAAYEAAHLYDRSGGSAKRAMPTEWTDVGHCC
jgi:hypothetical protein